MTSQLPTDPTEDGSEQSAQRLRDSIESAKVPERIGRYRIQRVLGRGGFGVVYLATDEQLGRPVAIKVSHSHLISGPAEATSYMEEARIVAGLDHANIVPVHDVGSTPEVPFYSVSKYIDGTDLAERLRRIRFRPRDAGELVASIAEALHYAHKQGLVHRDVKPANILLDRDGKPYLVDFGLALREAATADEGPRYVGTPQYTSPEQARGEGHRVDGRSDIFSLGVVFYELLTGKHAFKGKSRAELLRQVTSYEPKPPRQRDETIPKELERICLKAMAKLASERYSSAHDMVEDIRHFLSQQPISETIATSSAQETTRSETSGSPSNSDTVLKSDSNSQVTSSDRPPESVGARALRIVPKGIRSFDVHDADFFLQLVPGARDRDGLPDVVRFWKKRIEERDPEQTFPVGLIYGPSGCGKSSLVKAGLMPRLSDRVIPIMIEAAPGRTEARLRRAIEQKCPTLPAGSSLTETIKSIRNGYGPPRDNKVLLVIDQFEQWLHTSEPSQDSELAAALRQCDGARVQCILMVRDDFWMAVTHFMRRLEIRISEGQNSAAVDMFPIRHAIKVLDAFGRAFGTLPDDSEALSADQTGFLKQAVEGLANDGKVICVRLSLFAETMRSRAWTTKSLKELGGTHGVGLAYLEETFDSSSAPPEHRYHQRAARNVLRDLLPDSGTNIRQSTRTFEQLREASGYKDPQDFEELIEILTSELRLITPTDPEGFDDESEASPERNERYFQLTHDYLVHSLRSWLTQKQKETRRGRAELLLAERASLWEAKPENRYLPRLSETTRIRLLTDPKRWSSGERAMVKKATRVHVGRVCLVAATLLLLIGLGANVRSRLLDDQQRAKAQTLIEGLASAKIVLVKGYAEKLDPLRKWSDPMLASKLVDPALGDPKKLRIALAMREGPQQQQELTRQLCNVSVDEFPVVRDAIVASDDVSDYLWDMVDRDEASPEQRFQACCALAAYNPTDVRWDKASGFTFDYLTSVVPSSNLADRLDQLSAVHEKLVPHLLAALASSEPSDEALGQRAAESLATYLSGEPTRLVDAILSAQGYAEFEPLIQSLKPDFEQAKPYLVSVLSGESVAEAVTEETGNPYDANLRRRGIAAAVLVHFGQLSPVVPYLVHSQDPSLRSFIASFFQEIPVDDVALMEVADDETLDTSVLRILIQGLGSLNAEQMVVSGLMSETRRGELIAWLADLHREHLDAGVHSMSGWALRQWGVDTGGIITSQIKLDDRNEKLAKLREQIGQLEQQLAALGQQPEKQRAWERELAASPDVDEKLKSDLFLGLRFADKSLVVSGKDEATNGITDIKLDEDLEWTTSVFAHSPKVSQGKSINCGDIGNLDCSKPFSYGCWYNDNRRIRGWGCVLSKMDTSADNRGFDIWQNDGSIGMHLVHAEPDHYIKVVTIERPEPGEWHHVLATYDGSMKASGVRLYVDGVLQAADDVQVISDTLSEVDSPSIATSVPFMLGTRYGDFHFEGWVDDVRIYNRVLSAEEAKSVFDSGIQFLARIPEEDRTDYQQTFLSRYHPLNSELRIAKSKLGKVIWRGRRRWFVNGQQQTMIACQAKDEPMLRYDFAIAACEVTVDQWQRFPKPINVDRTTAPTDDCPMHNVTWHEVAHYCNWLSEQEGIPESEWVFEPNEDGIYGSGTRIRENFESLQGYRLPTHEEWKFACRAGATTEVFGFGTPVELADHYAWHGGNSFAYSHPVGSKLPNDYGVFDIHGNSWEWSLGAETEGISFRVTGKKPLYGGCFNSVRRNIQYYSNTRGEANERSNYHSFRVARSLP